MGSLDHCELLSALTPELFEPIQPHLLKFLLVLGEDRCAALYSLCKGYNAEEMTFVFWALMDDMNTLPFLSTGMVSSGAIARTNQLLLAAAHTAPAAAAYRVLDSKTVKNNTRDAAGLAREILRAAGQVINMSGADSLVVEIPDVKRHNPDIVSGAVIALTLNEPYSRSADLIRYLGTHWRELAPYAEHIAAMSDLTLNAAIHLVDGGPLVLTEGAL